MNHSYFAIIPARSGSKSIPHKNIRDFHGIPLLAWSIRAAQQCPLISDNDIFVTTDSSEYASIAQHFGAKTIIRPSSYADDLSSDLEFFQHLQSSVTTLPDAWIHLRPTYPIRNIDTLTQCIQTFDAEWDMWTSLRTVVPIDKSPFKMYQVHDQQLIPLFPSWNNIHEPYNQCRQLLPPTFLHNGNIDIIKNNTIVHSDSVTGSRIRCWIDHDPAIDIDTEQDWINAIQHPASTL